MKRLVLAYVTLLLLSCSPKIVPVENVVHHIYKDTTVVNIKDSIKIIPVERYVDVVPVYDTLKMQTSLAEALSYIDTTTHTLKGSLTNRKGFQTQIRTEYVYKTVRDTTYIKEPQPYPVEKIIRKTGGFFYFLLCWFVISLVLIGVKIYLKFFK